MRITSRLFGSFVLLALSACGGGGGSSGGIGNSAPQSYTVGGSVTSLSGSGLVLQNNAGNDLTIAASGNFTFSTVTANGAAYAVTVKTQPTNPAQICTATNASGNVSNANVTNITISCGTPLARIVFSDNGDIFAVNEDGSGLAALANALEYESVAMYRTSYDVASSGSSYNGVPFYQPMVRNGRVVYTREEVQADGGINRFQNDIYAVNLDGTGRVALAATTADESPVTLIGDRVVYLVDGSNSSALRSVLLDGSGDTLIATNGSALDLTLNVIATADPKIIYANSSGTFAVNADGSGQVTLWNQPALFAIVATDRVVLWASSGELVATNLDGSSFVSLDTSVVFQGEQLFADVSSISIGVASGRVFYTTGNGLYSLRSIGLDGTNPLLLGSSTTMFPSVYEISGKQLLVSETINNTTNDTVSYDITQANSRMLLLSSALPYRVVGNRVIGIGSIVANNGPITNETVSFLSINTDATAAAMLAVGATPASSNVDTTTWALFAPSQLLYHKSAPSGQLEGYAVDYDGNGGSVQITAGAGDKELMDIVSNRLVYQSYATGNTAAPRNLYSVALDGSAPVDLATTSDDERYLAQFSDRVLYTSSNGSVVDLKVVPVGGGTPVLLYSSPNTKYFIGAF